MDTTQLDLSLPDYSQLTLDDRDARYSQPTMNEQPVASTSSYHAPSTSSSTEVSRAPTPSSSSLSAPSTSSSTRTNPLTDLIATEKLYVDDLASVIKKVAAAWSRTNFPPPQLDTMFRAIEAVYRINKALLGKLTEIGPSPTSPKLLGDLLMRWIDELEPSYKRYSAALTCTFDDDPAVQSNARLASILAALPPIGSTRPGTPQPTEDEGPTTVDKLFILPYYRLRYYKKLYAKLLKSTQPGRSDHRLLVGANEKLDALIALCDESLAQAARARAVEAPPMEDAPTPIPQEELTPIPPVARQMESPALPPLPQEEPPMPPIGPPPSIPSSESSSRVVSSASSSSVGKRRSSLAASVSQSTMNSTGTAASLSTLALSGLAGIHVNELERRLDTARTLDIFSMKPKKCRLQMQPPTLGYTRTVRQAGEVALRFVPASDPNGREVSIQRACLVLLTDLFLVCEPVAAAERHEAAPGADLWLLFPPLSGKHLRVDVVEGDDLAFDISIMRKERLHVRCESRATMAAWLESFDECVTFGNNALRAKSESPSSGKSPVSPSSSAPRYPMSPVESTFSSQADRLSTPRSFSTISDPVGARSRSADPDYLPPPPRPVNGSNGYAQVDMHQATRRSSEGSALQPTFRPSSQASSAYGPPPIAPGSYRSMPPPPPGNGAGPSSMYGAPMPPFAQGFGSSGSRSSGGSPSVRTNMSRRTDPGMGGPNMPHFGSQSSLSARSDPQAMHRSRSADGLRQAPPVNTNGLHVSGDGRSHYRAPSTVSPIKSPMDLEDEEEDFDAELDRPPAALEPVKSQLAASMRCKVFLQQGRMQWKSVGTAKLRLYLQSPTNVKQLVVEQGDGGKAKPIISTIVLTDGVERVGKTGVAIELSDRGERTGIVYMLQMKTEQSATGLFQQLLLGSDRTSRIA